MAKATASNSNDALLDALFAEHIPETQVALTDRISTVVVNTAASTTRFVGKLSEAVDFSNFTDGRKMQRVDSLFDKRQVWEAWGAKHGFSLEQIARIASTPLR